MRMFSRSARECRSAFRVANHHAHVVAPALDALGFFAVEGLANLTAQVPGGETRGPPPKDRISSSSSCLPPRKESRMSITPGKLSQLPGLEHSGRLAKLFEPPAAELDHHRRARVQDRRAEDQLLGPGDLAGASSRQRRVISATVRSRSSAGTTSILHLAQVAPLGSGGDVRSRGPSACLIL